MTTTTERPMSKKALAEQERGEYTDRLRDILSPGDTVYTILRKVSRSGMMRHISLVIIEDGQPRDITGWAGLAMGTPWDRNSGGIKVGGCGMDMGFHLVYNLGRTLYPDGFTCAGQTCRSNDHSNGDQDYTPHLHKDGGYALWHRWL